MIDLLRKKAQGIAVSAAILIGVLQVILPTMFDMLFDALLVGLVWFAGKYGK